MNQPARKEPLVKKPPVNASELTPDNTTGFVKVRLKTPVASALQMNMPEGFVVDNEEEGRVRGQPGDWLVVVEGARMVVSKDYFEAHYMVLK